MAANEDRKRLTLRRRVLLDAFRIAALKKAKSLVGLCRNGVGKVEEESN